MQPLRFWLDAASTRNGSQHLVPSRWSCGEDRDATATLQTTALPSQTPGHLEKTHSFPRLFGPLQSCLLRPAWTAHRRGLSPWPAEPEVWTVPVRRPAGRRAGVGADDAQPTATLRSTGRPAWHRLLRRHPHRQPGAARRHARGRARRISVQSRGASPPTARATKDGDAGLRYEPTWTPTCSAHSLGSLRRPGYMREAGCHVPYAASWCPSGPPTEFTVGAGCNSRLASASPPRSSTSPRHPARPTLLPQTLFPT